MHKFIVYTAEISINEVQRSNIIEKKKSDVIFFVSFFFQLQT